MPPDPPRWSTHKCALTHATLASNPPLKIKYNSLILHIMAYGSTPYVGMAPPKKWWQHSKDMLEMSALD